MVSGAMWGLAIATFAASAVEVVEALTIVLAMGMTRSWRSALAGSFAALVALAAFTAAAGYALTTWLPEAAIKLAIGTLLLIFGLQWLRKAVLRSSGRKALHDEAEAFAAQSAAARRADERRRFGLDWFSFVVSLKGVFLEGVEVVFIVITFGLNAHNMPVAIVAASAAAVLVVVVGALAHGPLTRVPENTLKYAVGLLLTTFGTYWAIGGLGVLSASGQGLAWPGQDLSLLVLLAGWYLLSRALVRVLRRPNPGGHDRQPAQPAPVPTLNP
jgi:Ca2+/H+ antiporter, TMEM165/GDT1 family